MLAVFLWPEPNRLHCLNNILKAFARAAEDRMSSKSVKYRARGTRSLIKGTYHKQIVARLTAWAESQRESIANP